MILKYSKPFTKWDAVGFLLILVIPLGLKYLNRVMRANDDKETR